jgi:NADPH-dependent curcumin reductase CurA
MMGSTIARVIELRHAAVWPGDFVLGYGGWQSESVESGVNLRVLQPLEGVLITAHLGALGTPGFTAYAGLKVIGRPRSGETVVVAAAAGPVGSMVGQLAMRAGAGVIGVVSGKKKCQHLEVELGFDRAFDRANPDFERQLAAVADNGNDVYFENVRGPVARAVFPLLNYGARVPLCGLMSRFGAEPGRDAWRAEEVLSLVSPRSLLIQGFIQTEFGQDLRQEFRSAIPTLVRDGVIRYREDITQGLRNAPTAFRRMLFGESSGSLWEQSRTLTAPKDVVSKC